MQHFHFIGIGGMGMGALASLLLDKGCTVSGSDIKENYLTKRLSKKGARVFIGHDSENITGADTVVYSSAIDEDNCELTSAQQKKVPVLKRGQLLVQLMESYKGVTVVGSHGKTTVAAMVAHLMFEAGLEPTTAVGGIAGEGANALLGNGKYFVAELDESDGSFLYCSPYYSIITNIDFEHVDYYQSWDAIIDSYKKFISNTDTDGHIFAYGDDERLYRLVTKSKCAYITYGFTPKNDIVATDVITEGYRCSFDCTVKDKKLGTFELRVPGRYNVLNALACISLGCELSLDFNVIYNSLLKYRGVQRRFQLKADINNILIIDDYGHHPTEISNTIEAARSFNRDRVIVVFQPHRYTRTKLLMDEFVKSLIPSDYLIITDIYAASEPSIKGVSASQLYEKIKAKGPTKVAYCKKGEIVEHLNGVIREGDLVLTLGAGDINQIADDLVRALKEKS